jgi:hypothetical protein
MKQNIAVVLLVGIIVWWLFSSKKEHYRDPIYLNKKKFKCDWYPRANGSIYGGQSNVLTGFSFYDRAY